MKQEDNGIKDADHHKISFEIQAKLRELGYCKEELGNSRFHIKRNIRKGLCENRIKEAIKLQNQEWVEEIDRYLEEVTTRMGYCSNGEWTAYDAVKRNLKALKERMTK